MYKKSNYAFTLAEILITLAIIGIVAAITIPSVVTKYQKDETLVRLKKIYADLAQTVKLSEAENGPNKDWDWGEVGSLSESFNTYWKPYLKIQKICTTCLGCGYKLNKPWLNLANEEYDLSPVSLSTRTSFILQDGTFVMIRSYTGATPPALSKMIVVDLNGAKPPNKLGNDTFSFVLNEKLGLVPLGFNDNIADICTSSTTGINCAAKIVRDSWQIKDDYPW